MVLTAESVKGRVVLPLLIQPSILTASHLAALLQAGSGSLSGTVTGYPEQVADQAAPVLLPGRSAVETGHDQLPRPARSRWSWQGVTNRSASKVMFAWQLLER